MSLFELSGICLELSFYGLSYDVTSVEDACVEVKVILWVMSHHAGCLLLNRGVWCALSAVTS